MGSKVHIRSRGAYDNMLPGANKELYQKHNPGGMTVSQARYTLEPWLKSTGGDLQAAISGANMNKNSVGFGVPYQYLINDTGEDLKGLNNYKTLGFSEARPLADQFGGQYQLDPIKAIIDQFNTNTTAKNSFAADAAAADAAAAEKIAAAEAAEANTPSYLTQDDLSSWWEGVDKSAWGQQKSKSNGMDDFMKMMMFMSMMRPQGGRGGGGGMGLNNISQLVSAFGQMNGSNTTT